MTEERSPVIGRRGSYAKGVARRQEILDRAIEVFADRGADGTSLRQIAQAIGVSHAALLHYFDSREQLLVAVYEHAEQMRNAKHPEDPESPAVDMLTLAATQNLAVPGLVQLYSTLVAASLEERSDEGKRFFTERFAHVRAALVERLRRDQADGRVRDDIDSAVLASLLVAASDGLQIQWLLEPELDLEGSLRVFETLLKPQ